MKTTLITIGKTDASYLNTGITDYVSRIGHYIPFEMCVIPDVKSVKNKSEAQQKDEEGKRILALLKPSDVVLLLDEGGRQFTSRQFADFFSKTSLSGAQRLVFIIGGPYGFSPDVYARATSKISLSPMTFSHQMVRLIFLEQLYRAQTILKGEPYHHD